MLQLGPTEGLEPNPQTRILKLPNESGLNWVSGAGVSGTTGVRETGRRTSDRGGEGGGRGGQGFSMRQERKPGWSSPSRVCKGFWQYCWLCPEPAKVRVTVRQCWGGDGHSDWCEVIAQCSFALHCSKNYWCWASFLVFFGHLYVFFLCMPWEINWAK